MDGFAPDKTALALVEEDVRKPWTGTYVSRWRGRLAARRVRTRVVQTPHDGIAKFVLSSRPGSAIAVLDPATGKVRVAATKQIQYGVCGERRLTLAAASLRGGKFSVMIARP
jgi:hypothetical protein